MNNRWRVLLKRKMELQFSSNKNKTKIVWKLKEEKWKNNSKEVYSLMKNMFQKECKWHDILLRTSNDDLLVASEICCIPKGIYCYFIFILSYMYEIFSGHAESCCDYGRCKTLCWRKRNEKWTKIWPLPLLHFTTASWTNLTNHWSKSFYFILF